MSNSSSTISYSRVEQQLGFLATLIQQLQAQLAQNRSASMPTHIYENVNMAANLVTTLRPQIQGIETERLNLRALAEVGELVNSTLEIDEVLQIVMDTIIRITGAERGFLMLTNNQGQLAMRIARNWEKESLDSSEFNISHTIINRVLADGQPLLTTNAQEDPRFQGQQSIIAHNLRSILCVPLKVKSQFIGVIYADNRVRSGLFTQKELNLLAGFANQAAVALENARLFASVRNSLAEVTALKNLMDNVFASITSGVLTADIEERILMCNRAAESILGQTSLQLIGQQIDQILPPLATGIQSHLDQVISSDQAVISQEFSPVLQNRGQVDLRFSISPLKDLQHTTQGITIVLEDLTEKKKLEAQRRLFERMVSPRVIEHLNPDSLRLGGQRTEITVLFADIRGFTSFSEGVSPEQLVAVLNQYLAAAAEAVLEEEGTIDKFLGDAVMAWYNAPIPQADHTLRAVRSALGIRSALATLHARLPNSSYLDFGVGIHYGEAVLGLVGTERRLEFTAIGDCVNTAKRIQENSAAGQILISQAAYALVADCINVKPVEPILAKGKRDPIPVYQILGLR